MTVVQRAASAALNFLTGSRADDPAPAVEPPRAAPTTAVAAAGAASIVPRPERRAPWPRQTAGLPPGKRERRVRVERRRSDRRKADMGSPYGAERRSGHDDRQGDRRTLPATARAGIGLTRDYFSQTGTAPVAATGSDVPAHLLIRFKQ